MEMLARVMELSESDEEALGATYGDVGESYGAVRV